MIGVNIKSMFFNTKHVLDCVDKGRIKVLSEAGYKVQQSGKKLLVYKAPVKRPRLSKNYAKRLRQLDDYYRRKKADASKPGDVPFIRRRGYPNLSSIVYGYNSANGALLVGPIVRTRRSSATPVPGIAARGGTTVINVKTKKGLKPMTAHYDARPVMVPALNKVLPEMPQVLESSVVGP